MAQENQGISDSGPGDGLAAGGSEPAEVLSEVRRLRRQARSVRHAYWFPLVLFGVLTCAAVPFYLQPSMPACRNPNGCVVEGTSPGPYLPVLGGGDQAYYWIVAILAGTTLTALWYRRHARQVGLVTPAKGYLITGVVLTLLALLLPPLSGLRPLRWLGLLWPGDLVIRGTFPLVIVAAGLWVLARAERSSALAVIALVFSGTALLASLYDISNVIYRLGWNLDYRVEALPNVLLPAAVLLVAGTGAFLAQRHSRSAA